MALCPLAIASTADQTNGTGKYYFALNGGGTGPVRDQAFVAEGFGSPPNQGFFAATSEDTTGAGTNAFIMTDLSGVNRWAIGASGVEAGANSGDNFAIYSYSDAGAFLAAPLTINRASGGVQMQNGLTVGNSLISTGPLVAPNVATASNRVASASFVPDPIVVNPSAAIFTLNAGSMPGLAALIANPAVNIIQLFSQFGVQTTAGQPKMNLGLTFQADGGGALLSNGTVCLGQATGSAVASPGEYPYVLYANLVRGVHFTGTTTQIVVGASADTTPNGAVITLLNNDDNAGTPTSPSIVISALGMM